jgi:hypothetical protein
MAHGRSDLMLLPAGVAQAISDILEDLETPPSLAELEERVAALEAQIAAEQNAAAKRLLQITLLSLLTFWLGLNGVPAE